MNAMLDPKAIAQCYGGTASGNQVNIPTEGQPSCTGSTLTHVVQLSC